MKKKLLITILLIMICFPITVFASTKTYERDKEKLDVWENIDKEKYKEEILNTPKVDEKEKIYDFADLYTDYEEEQLYASVMKYIESYKLDMVILTIDKNNKKDAQTYAEEFYIYNYFGFEDAKRSGCIFIIDMDNREYYLATSGSVIKYLDDERVDNILDEASTYIRDGKYYAATDNAIKLIQEYGKTVPSSNTHVIIDDNGYVKLEKSPNIFISFIVSVIVAIIFVSINISKHKGIVLATNANQYMNRANEDKVVEDKLISSVTTTRVVPKDDPPSGGGHMVGGSSVHIGGGGHTFGGGGRHF